MCAAFELNLVWPKLLQFLVFVLPVLPDYWSSDFVSFYFLVCMLAFTLVCEFLYILILFFFSFFLFFFWIRNQNNDCRVTRTFQLGTWIFTTWRTKWRMWMYSFINQTIYTFLVCLNLGLPLTSVTRWLAFQIIQSYEGTRVNLGMQGSRCMFMILFRISLIGAMIWNLRMSKTFDFRPKQEEALLSS